MNFIALEKLCISEPVICRKLTKADPAKRQAEEAVHWAMDWSQETALDQFMPPPHLNYS